MTYCQGPYTGGTSLAPDGRAAEHSSRKIDAATMRYVIASDGGFEPMDDVAQCVLLAIAMTKGSGRLTTQQQNKRKVEIREALAHLTRGPEPIIKIIEIFITDNGRDTQFEQVTYLNLLTNTQTTVER